MTRTTTAAAAPAPRNGRNGKIRTVKVDPATLAAASAAELAAPVLPDSIAAAIAAAKAEAAAKRQQRAAKATPAARVKLTAPQAAAMAAIGWKAPAVNAANEWKPEARTRANNCAADAAYTAALALLKAQGALAVGDLAQVWAGCQLKPRAIAAVAQQLANRAGRTVNQKGGILSLT